MFGKAWAPPLHLKVEDSGRNNVVEVAGGGPDLKGVVRLQGDNNHVRIGAGCRSYGLLIEMLGNARLEIGGKCRLGGLEAHLHARGEISIGQECGFVGKSFLYLHEPGKISIGERCLVAAGCWVTVSDMHSIIDVASGKRINPARDVRIRDHVWLGRDVAVLKGSDIGSDTMIGTKAAVTGVIPSGVVAVGNPARVVREGITWDNRLL